MKIQYTTELDYPFECLALLTRLIAPNAAGDGTYQSFDTFREDLRSVPAQATDEIETIFNQIERTAKEILSRLTISDEKLRFYFTPFYENISPAALLLYSRSILSRPEAEQTPLLCREILSCLVEELLDAPELPETEDEFLRFLDRLPVPVEAKWHSLLFFRNFTEYDRELSPVFAQAETLLRERLPFFSPYIVRELSKIQAAISEQGTALLGTRYRINPNAETITLGISLMQYNSIEMRAANAILAGCENNLTFRVGILVNPIMEQREKQSWGDENLLRSLKALNDKNRLQILQLLKRAPLCGQEIAEQLGITPATVSHHMSDLANRNFVALERVGAKINYRLFPAGIQAFLEELQKRLL